MSTLQTVSLLEVSATWVLLKFCYRFSERFLHEVMGKVLDFKPLMNECLPILMFYKLENNSANKKTSDKLL